MLYMLIQGSNWSFFNTYRDLKHQNICTFHGCLLRKFHIALLFQHCVRGSLESILLRSDIQFDWIFKLSFALDAAQAMAFLHSKKIIHGRLSSSNCMIDEEWTLKIQGKCVGIYLGASELVEIVSLNKVQACSSITDQ